MSLFGKLKENLTHGGVKIALNAPASVSMNDANVPVTVTVTASDEQQTIERVLVSINAVSYDKSFSMQSDPNINNTAQTPQNAPQVVAQAGYAQPFTLMPGESKTLDLSIVMNQGANIASQLPQNSGLAQVAGALQAVQSVSEAMNNNSYQYFIDASAKLDGVALSPKVQQPIQVLKPGEFGTAIQR